MRRHRPPKPSAIMLANRLPPAGHMRWAAGDKAAVVVALRAGFITVSEAYDRYMLSLEELRQWEAAFDQDGIAGLTSAELLDHREEHAPTRTCRIFPPDRRGPRTR